MTLAPQAPLQKWQSFKTSEGIQMCKNAQKVAVLSEWNHRRSQSHLHYLQKWTHKKKAERELTDNARFRNFVPLRKLMIVIVKL